MTSDSVWQILRYLLLAGGSVLIGHGIASESDVTAAIAAIGTLFTFAWGIYVHWNTKAVPVATAARPDVPTVSPVTGATQPGTAFTG